MDIKFEPFKLMKLESKASYQYQYIFKYKVTDKKETLHMAVFPIVLHEAYVKELEEEGIDKDLIYTESEFIKSNIWKDTDNKIIYNKLYEMYIQKKTKNDILKGG